MTVAASAGIGLWADPADLDRPTSPNAMEALQGASYLLWVLSGRRWSGVHEVTEEYSHRRGMVCTGGWCSSIHEMNVARARVRRALRDPSWGWREDQRLRGQQVVPLRQRPARSIIALRRTTSGGGDLDPADYAIYDNAFLAPAASECSTPCADLNCIEVTYTWGSNPPPTGRSAALDLANEFVKSIECPDQCRLPERITSISRQGVSLQVFDPQDFLADGRVGIYSVDLFLKTVNPDRAQRRARVFNPDSMRARRQTWPKRVEPPIGWS